MYNTFKQLELEGKTISVFFEAGGEEGVVFLVLKVLPEGLLVKESPNIKGFLAYSAITYFQILNSQEYNGLTKKDRNGNLSIVNN